MSDCTRPLRALRPVAGVTALAALAAALAWAAGSPFALAERVSGAADFQQLLVGVAAVAAWAGLLWFAALVALQAGSAVPGALGAACGRVARRAGPRVLQRSARGLIGLTMLAAPLISTPAMAAQPAASRPNLDRPVAAATHPSAPAATQLPPLDRPIATYLPPPPRPAPKVAPADGARLLTGAPHRNVVDDTYVVRAGDALWTIAARHLGAAASPADIAREWPRWYAANHSVIGPNPGLLLPGQVLRAPAG